MIDRHCQPKIQKAMDRNSAVAILGPRQVGKTTLALALKNMVREKPVVYVDLERPSDRVKLEEPELFLRDQAGRLVIWMRFSDCLKFFRSSEAWSMRGVEPGNAPASFSCWDRRRRSCCGNPPNPLPAESLIMS